MTKLISIKRKNCTKYQLNHIPNAVSTIYKFHKELPVHAYPRVKYIFAAENRKKKKNQDRLVKINTNPILHHEMYEPYPDILLNVLLTTRGAQ